jgi:hypothetical protein
MLIATAITLVMMAAVVNLFANLSGSIRNRRAVIELSNQIRQVRQRLALDLAGCTVPLNPAGLVPWQRAGEGIGYFEIIEGGLSDSRPSRLVDGIEDTTSAPPNLEIDYATSVIPSGGDPLLLLPGQINNRTPYDTDVTNGGGLGDADDILALTVQSETQPFTGSFEVPSNNPSVTSQPGFPDPTNDLHWMRAPIESDKAEVIWWADEAQPGNPAGREPGMRRIYRRVLLIPPAGLNLRQYSGTNALQRFFSRNDISVHRDGHTGEPIIANTLADLTRREYRYGRSIDVAPFPNPPYNAYPFAIDRSQFPDDSRFLVLNDALAFDVRVYDPGAPVYSVSGGVLVNPNDPAWNAAVQGTLTPPANLATFGAYVDLGWNDAGSYNYAMLAPALGAPAPLFQQEHRAGWHPIYPYRNGPYRGAPAVYDTWTWHYENDGIDQDDTTGNDNSSDQNAQTGAIDEGTNGRDDAYTVPDPTVDVAPPASAPQYVNGKDDVLERETSPPYPVPLRGIKVIFRTYERDARQVREASVTHSFVP